MQKIISILWCSLITATTIPIALSQGLQETKRPNNAIDRISETLEIAVPLQKYTLNFIKSLSVFESTLYTALYSGIVTADPQTLQPRPGLAVSWFINDDKTIYTFNLRSNAHFSDGSLITADDVKASWLTTIMAKTPFEHLFYPIRGVTDYVQGKGSIKNIGIEVLSEKVLQITLEQPTNYFLKTITHGSFSVTSKFQLADKNWNAKPQDILYSGAYTVQSADDNKIILTKNNHFWNTKKVSTEKIIIHLYNDKTAQIFFKKFIDGHIQWMDPNGLHDVSLLNTVEKKMLQEFSLFGTSYLFFKATNEPWSNSLVRRAIRLLLPLDILLPQKYLFPASSLVPNINAVYNLAQENIPPSDEKQAFELLKNAGYRRGKGLPPLIMLAPSDKDGSYNEIFDTIYSILTAKLETEIRITPINAKLYQSALLTENFTIGISSWVGDFADPMAFLQMWMYPNASLGHYYNNDEFRTLIQTSLTLSDQERESVLQSAERKLLYDSIVIPLQYLYTIELVRNDKITGWFQNPLNIHNLVAISFVPIPFTPYIIYNPKIQRLILCQNASDSK